MAAGGGIKINNISVRGGSDGATFIPKVSSEGVLSWSNNKGYTNPASVNIKGQQGAQGPIGVTPKISVEASVDDAVGTPSVAVVRSGTDDAPTFRLDFKNIKGETGDPADLNIQNATGAGALVQKVPEGEDENTASGRSSVAFGKSSIAGYDNQTALGGYNDNKSNTLLEIGNGTSKDDRSNAFEVLRDGRAKVYGVPTEDEDVVRLKELNDSLTKVYRYKGSVENVSNLPTSNNVIGDVYNVEATGQNYAWNGTKWDALGATDYVNLESNQTINGIKIFTNDIEFGSLQTNGKRAQFQGGSLNIMGVDGHYTMYSVDEIDTFDETANQTTYSINRYGLGSVALGYYPKETPTETSLIQMSSDGTVSYLDYSKVVTTDTQQKITEQKLFTEDVCIGSVFGDDLQIGQYSATFTPDSGINYYTMFYPEQTGTLVVRPKDAPTADSLLQISSTGQTSYKALDTLISVPASNAYTQYENINGVYEFLRVVTVDDDGEKTAATRYTSQGIYSSLGTRGIGFHNGKLIKTDGNDEITLGIIPEDRKGYTISRSFSEDYELGYLPNTMPTTNSIPIYSSTGSVSWEEKKDYIYNPKANVRQKYEDGILMFTYKESDTSTRNLYLRGDCVSFTPQYNKNCNILQYHGDYIYMYYGKADTPYWTNYRFTSSNIGLVTIGYLPFTRKTKPALPLYAADDTASWKYLDEIVPSTDLLVNEKNIPVYNSTGTITEVVDKDDLYYDAILVGSIESFYDTISVDPAVVNKAKLKHAPLMLQNNVYDTVYLWHCGTLSPTEQWMGFYANQLDEFYIVNATHDGDGNFTLTFKDTSAIKRYYKHNITVNSRYMFTVTSHNGKYSATLLPSNDLVKNVAITDATDMQIGIIQQISGTTLTYYAMTTSGLEMKTVTISTLADDIITL